MSGMDPQTLQIFAVVSAAIGLGQLFFGVVLSRSADNARRFQSCVMQGGGVGFLGCAAIGYFAAEKSWAFIAGITVMAAGTAIGTIVGKRYLNNGMSR